MPRSTADNNYERAEAEALALPDRCEVRIWTMVPDGGGGRVLSGSPPAYSDLPCRLDRDGSGIERSDADGERIVSDYILKMGANNGIDEVELGGLEGTYVDLRVTWLNGGPKNRFFYLISYGEVSEMGLRQLYVREIKP
ncbi:MAG: hypothetical protein ABI670_19665 [Chloroflexota bacterium]